MKIVALTLTLTICGCVDAPAVQPSPAQQKMQAACDAGDMAACKVILDKDEREGASRQARVQAALSGIGRDTSAVDTYAKIAMKPQSVVPMTPLTVTPVMISCFPYEPVAAPGPCPR